MSIVMGFDEISAEKVRYRPSPNGGPGTSNTPFFKATSDTPVAPTAFVARYDPGRFSSAHFHEVDQFQIIVDGSGTFGRHDVSPFCVHFSRAHTRYGPLQADNKTGWAFMTLRTRYDPGAQRTMDKLKAVTDRTPWQVTKKAEFAKPSKDVSIQDIPEIEDEQGLFARTLTMLPNTKFTAPDPSGGDGQYIVIVKGSVLHEGKEQRSLTVIFVKPDEKAFELHAGAQGLEALILNFPKVAPRSLKSPAPAQSTGLKKWQCVLCSFAYDEALGMPEDGIAAGTRWEDVPDTWSCPDCGATKSDFEMAEVVSH